MRNQNYKKQKVESVVKEIISDNKFTEDRVCEKLYYVSRKLYDTGKDVVDLYSSILYSKDTPLDKIISLVLNARAEAIKEFAEQVKMVFYHEFDELIPSIMADKIDNLVKEMTENKE